MGIQKANKINGDAWGVPPLLRVFPGCGVRPPARSPVAVQLQLLAVRTPFGPRSSTPCQPASPQPLTPTLRLRNGLCEQPHVEASSGLPAAWKQDAASERLLLTCKVSMTSPPRLLGARCCPAAFRATSGFTTLAKYAVNMCFAALCRAPSEWAAGTSPSLP